MGHAVRLLMNDPTINPATFALVRMGVFYGGIARVPLSALVLVCELAEDLRLAHVLHAGARIAL